MFRENVLIALTILVTVLALSFVILITAYMQLYDLERKLANDEVASKPQMGGEDEDAMEGKTEETTTQIAQKFDSEHSFFKQQQLLIQETQALWDAQVERFNEMYNNQNKDDDEEGTRRDYNTPFVFGGIRFDDEVKPTTEMTPPDFGIDSGGQELDADKIQIPYHFNRRSGHVVLEIPKVSDSGPRGKLINYTEDVIPKITESMQDYQWRQRIKEIEERILMMNGFARFGRFKAWPLLRPARRNDQRLWFTKDVLREMMKAAEMERKKEKEGQMDDDFKK